MLDFLHSQRRYQLVWGHDLSSPGFMAVTFAEFAGIPSRWADPCAKRCPLKMERTCTTNTRPHYRPRRKLATEAHGRLDEVRPLGPHRVEADALRGWLSRVSTDGQQFQPAEGPAKRLDESADVDRRSPLGRGEVVEGPIDDSRGGHDPRSIHPRARRTNMRLTERFGCSLNRARPTRAAPPRRHPR